MRYSQSGALVEYIDEKYGRATITTLMHHGTKAQILTTLNITEAQLIENWKQYFLTKNQ